MSIVSILVPVFKAEKYIEKCARSLFEQTYSDLEFVFVDDCSPDNSIEVLNTILKDYPTRKGHTKIVFNSSNRGVAACRNIAVDHAEGDFICFVDADDWLELDAIELLIERQQMQNADIVYGNAMMHTPKGVIKLSEGAYESKHKMMLCYSQFTPGYVMVLWRRLIRRSLIIDNSIRAVEGLNYAEDKCLLVRLGYYSSIVSYVDSIVYHYNRINEDSLVSTAMRTSFPLSPHRQEIDNMKEIVRFFEDKREKEYYEESSRALLQFIISCMNEALSVSSRTGFYAMAGCMKQTNPVFLDEIGWNSLKTHFYGNYWFMKTYRSFKEIAKRLKRFFA